MRGTLPLIAGLAITLFAIQPAKCDDELYRAFGGKEHIAKIVDDATDRWVNDPRIGPTFDNLNLVRFKALLTDQLCELTGGPCRYKGRDMYRSHKGLHLNVGEFNALVEGLQFAMDDYQIPFWTQNRLLAILAPMERDIVTR